jgi:exosortase
VGILAVLAAILLWSYWPTLRSLISFWWEGSDYAAGALVPLVAACVFWSQRRRLRQIPVSVCWTGLAIVLVAQVARFYGLLYIYGSLEQLSLLLTLAGGCLLILGRQMTRRLGPILLFLVLMFPLPVRVHHAVALPLQNLASGSAVVGLEMLGQLVTRNGHVLRLSDQTTVAVAEACSGLRMLSAFVIVAAALALTAPRPAWEKAVLVASSIPIGIFANTIRLVVAVLLFKHIDSQTSERFFHDFAGIVMIPFAWALLVTELRLLDWMAERKHVGDHVPGKPGGNGVAGRSIVRPVLPTVGATMPRWSAVPVVALTACLVLGGLGHRLVAARIDVALSQAAMPARPLSTFPLVVGLWQGRDLPIDAAIIEAAREDDSLHRQYERADTRRAVGLYVGYIGRARSWLGHRPDVCYPANGFRTVGQERVEIRMAGGVDIAGLLHEFESPEPAGRRVLVLVTYIINGTFVADLETVRQFNTRNTWQEAYVARIQIWLPASGNREDDVALLEHFAGQIVGPLAEMMPHSQ